MRHTTFALTAAAVRALTNAPLHDVTPLIRSAPLSNKLNCDVFFKMDCAQPPGSFKLRGIGATVKEAVERGADGVVSSADGSDERWPKWSTLQQQQLDLGTGEWRQDHVDWWAPASLAHRTL